MTFKKAKKTISTVISMLLLVNILPTTIAFADSSYICEDGTLYSFDESIGKLTISIESETTYSYDGCMPTSLSDDIWNSLKSHIKSVVIKDGITSICQSLFCNCKNLTCINIPNSVTSIGERAFSGCSGLTSVTYRGIITGGVFENCPLKVINVPSNFWEETFFGICVTRES